MYRHKFLHTLFSILLVLRVQAQTDVDSSVNKIKGALMVVVTSLEMKEKALNMVYEIRNRSEDDAWIFTGGHQLSESTFGMGAGVHMSEDGHTLTIRASFDVQSGVESLAPVYGRFIRLRPGESQTESIFLRTPVHLYSVTEQQEQDPKYATRLAIELGYYSGNLPERILRTLEEQEKDRPMDSRETVLPHLFSTCNESLISRDEELLTLPCRQFEEIEHQQVSRAIVENVHVPYEEKPYPSRPPKIEAPDLASCTKIELEYQPSLLEYFFPYAFQQRLLSPDELKYLQSEKAFVGDKEDLNAIANDVKKGGTGIGGVVVRYRGHVDVVCYYDGKPPVSFPICNDNVLLIEGEQWICREGFPSLKIRTPQIQAMDLRMRCAANLKNLWYRLRFYHFHEAVRWKDPSIRNRMTYPTPSQWCDDLLRPYPVLGGSGKWREAHVCPSVGEGKSTYAMNPNCRPDSPADMVLLFETKAGWNQNGGPKLFTFDNHDPRGGCVLLNDGTVKFIRTTEELQQLRWK